MLPAGLLPTAAFVDAPALLDNVNPGSTAGEALLMDVRPPNVISEVPAPFGNICPGGTANEIPETSLFIGILSPDAVEGLALLGTSDTPPAANGPDNSNSKNSKVFGFGARGAFSFVEDS
uniref:Uncharacterized protein MANES_16G068700 n=1 Tax=Rhizophora mucronata TaxID=61149 RepID=A0A2P2ISF0_RHIMU